MSTKKLSPMPKKEASSLIDQANKAAKSESEPVIAKAKADTEKILNTEKIDAKALIKELTERIVKDGNS